MEIWVEFHHLHHFSGASWQNSVVAFSQTTEVDGDLYLNVNKQPHRSSAVVQVCRSLNIPDGFEKMLFNIYTLILKLKCS